MPEQDSGELTARLQQLIETVDVARMMTEPFIDSIDKLLRVSAANMKSEEASVLVREGSGGDLRFLTAIGKVADRLCFGCSLRI